VTFRELAKEAWDVARDIAKTVPARLSWREALRLLRRSLPAALCERAVGLVLLGLVLTAFATLAYLVAYVYITALGRP